MPLPRKLLSPIFDSASRNDVGDICMFIIFSPSEIIVPLPILQRNGLSCFWSLPMFEPV
jgi:hypothetical protein